MSVDLTHPLPQMSPAKALQMSQRAPKVLQTSTSLSLPYPLSLLTSTETPETWIALENLLLSCLRTGDDRSARQCLDKLTSRFGEKNERVMALRGMYEEAVAEDDEALARVLKRYGDILKEDGTNMPVRRRHVALLRAMGKHTEATQALVELLHISPTDAEAWSELSDLYLEQGMYPQAIFSLEEVLLVTPNAWNVHARMGELVYLSTLATSPSNSGNQLRALSESMRRFCRSIELCDNYLRGYYGLKLTTKRLLTLVPKTPEPSTAVSDPGFGDLAPPSMASVQRLHELATAKLAEIVRRNSAGEVGWEGYDQAEVIAARELLDRDTQGIER